MTLPERDRGIVALVNLFGQLSSRQIQEILFADLSTRTPAERALRRLVDSGHLARVERRIVGGSRGGSGQYVYVLGREGWRMCDREGRYYKPSVPDYHSLAISDVYVQLARAERAGLLRVESVSTEPDCWLTVQGIELRPDLAVELSRPGGTGRLAIFVEVDMGTERQSRIAEKLRRYMEAYKRATRAELLEYRRIYFVSENEPRRAEIERLIDRLDEGERKYFRSVLLDTFPQAL